MGNRTCGFSFLLYFHSEWGKNTSEGMLIEGGRSVRNRILQFALVFLVAGGIIWGLYQLGYLFYVLTISATVVPLAVIMIIFIENRTAESTIAWFLVLIF